MPTDAPEAARRLALDIYRACRLSASGASLTLPLLGAAAGGAPDPPLARLLAAGACFHLFAYLHNDVLDLPFDRRAPMRRAYPLVAGRLAPGAALALALAAAAAALALARGPEARPGARRAMAAALALMAAYNRWGKACPLPPLTDMAQALGWAALLAWGTLAAGGRVGRGSLALAAHEVALIMLVNGVHGGLRDLASDLEGGARTTAIWLGARPGAGLTPRVAAYALAWQAAALAALGALAAGHPPAGRRLALAALAALAGATAWAVGEARADGGPEASVAVGMAHLIAALSAPVAAAAPAMGPRLLAATLAAHTLPLLANGMTYDAARWIARRAALRRP